MSDKQTQFEAELEAAAVKYMTEDFDRNPEGYTVAPYVNEYTTYDAFEAGARWALQSALVQELVEALEWAMAGIEHFTSDEDAEQVAHIRKHISEKLEKFRAQVGE